MLYQKHIPSPLGKITLVASNTGLRFVGFENQDYTSDELQVSETHPMLLKAEKQLGEYFAGKRKMFDVTVELRGTVFQIKAWRALQTIPYGKTISYGEQAKLLGNSNRARTAGVANSKNPISIIVPCHRVIGANGTLTGYAGGLNRKQHLLALEQKN